MIYKADIDLKYNPNCAHQYSIFIMDVYVLTNCKAKKAETKLNFGTDETDLIRLKVDLQKLMNCISK